MARLDVRIALFLVRAARMGYCPTDRWSNLLSIFPKRTRRMVSRASAPFGLALGELLVAQIYVKSTGDGVDLDDVAILEQPDRAADGGFRPDMADAEATGGSGEAAVGGPIGLLEDGDIIEIDAVDGTLNVNLSDAELAQRKTKWQARATNHTTGALWKYAQQVGPAIGGAVTHPGGAHEKQCYADI
jgi:hypothetical protein